VSGKRQARQGHSYHDDDQPAAMTPEQAGMVIYGMETDTVQNEDGSVSVGHLRLFKTGLKIERNIDENEWFRYLSGLQSIKRKWQWMLADLLHYGVEREYGKTGEKFQQLSDITGLSEQALNDYAWVAGKVEISCRQENLSFEHHKKVAKLSTEEQQKYLTYAVEHELSVRDFVAHLAGVKVVDPTPLDVFNKRWHAFRKSQKALAGQMTAEQKAAMARDLRALADEIEGKSNPKQQK
jgi:hypothetical protein